MNRATWLALSAILLFALPAQAGYHVNRVDFPGATATFVMGANDLGQYVGIYADATGTHALFFDGRHLVQLDKAGFLGSMPKSRAYAMNNRGDIVGSYNDASGGLHGYLYRHGVVTTIDDPAGAPTECYGINDRGDIVGVTYDDDFDSHGFTYIHGEFASADVPGSFATVPLSVNDLGVIVGEDIEVPGTVGHGYRQRPCSLTTYDSPSAPEDSTYFSSINNLGAVLGTWFDPDDNAFPFVLFLGRETPFELPASFGSIFTSAQTLNDFGEIVGYYFDADGAIHGFRALPW